MPQCAPTATDNCNCILWSTLATNINSALFTVLVTILKIIFIDLLLNTILWIYNINLHVLLNSPFCFHLPYWCIVERFHHTSPHTVCIFSITHRHNYHHHCHHHNYHTVSIIYKLSVQSPNYTHCPEYILYYSKHVCTHLHSNTGHNIRIVSRTAVE